MKSKPTPPTPPKSIPTGQGQPPSPVTGNPPPSVPISVYRELAAELQATKAMLESMNTQNQQLTRQNQQFHREIERLMQSALTLQQLAGLAPAQNRVEMAAAPVAPAIADMVRNQTLRSKTQPTRPGTEAVVPPAVNDDSLSGDLFTEQGENPHRMESTSKPKDLSGLWLTMTIVVITLTAFGAGFLVFRAFLPRR